ncbi:MAG: hypothetical protein A2Y81_05570 [Nitrospirae bacterium RBG_13_43_8]|nr:MAG: hypothetical protein A2Y81_05570 [Nitrospirae bacterium RBG_13_43_8]
MHRWFIFIIFAVTLTFGSSVIAGDFNSGSTGANGAFNPTTNTELQLPSDGIFNFTTVNIPAGVTITFKKNASNTPVYILATGDVTVAGTINVNGANTTTNYPGKGGPGGFDGGLGGITAGMPGGKGLGPGGGNPGAAGTTGGGGGGGSFGTDGTNGSGTAAGTAGAIYGNERILPMIGGSGGGGGNFYSGSSTTGGGGGGGGGGAILIASSGTINVIGTITANGGNAPTGYGYGAPFGGGAGGSGGAIKLIANTIAGNGTISAIFGYGTRYGSSPGGSGGNGSIRFEANTVTRTASTTPVNTYSHPSTVFVANIPVLSITSIAGENVPENPSGTYGSPDMILPSATTNPVTVDISATNIPAGTTVTVTSVPEYGASTSATGALSGTGELSTTSVQITISTSYQSIVKAQATFTIQTAMYYEGEKIQKVMVASTMGKGSEVTYITETGKEIPARELFAKAIGVTH